MAKRENLKAFLLYVLAIAVLYFPAVFLGKSLQPSLYQPHGVVSGWPWGYAGRVPADVFNIDLATPAYYESPVNKLVGDLYKSGELPLWNPYQAAGTPLLLQYSSRVFFPYQILEDISPVWLWDYFILGRLLAAGFFTFLFLRSIGLSFMPAFTGGLLYMFSGSFTWFINLEQYANNAMMLPVFIYAVERLVKSGGLWGIPFCAVSIGLTLLAGQPEIALYVFALGGFYYLFSILLMRSGLREAMGGIARFLISTVIGFALASVLLVPFAYFMKEAYHLHPSGGKMGTMNPRPGFEATQIISPTIAEVQLNEYPETTIKGVTPAGEPFSHMIFPFAALWDSMGGYTGVIPALIMATGLFAAAFSKEKKWLPYIVFFLSAGLVIVLKNFGIRPFFWIGNIPLFDQVWTQRWAGSVWTFSFAVSGAAGLEAIRGYYGAEGGGLKDKKGWVLPLCGSALTLALYIFLFTLLSIKFHSIVAKARPGLGLLESFLFLLERKPSVAYPLATGALATLALLLLSSAALFYNGVRERGGRGERAIYAVGALAVIEIWWNICRGYGYEGSLLKTVPLSIGVMAAAALLFERRSVALLAAVLFTVSFAWLDYRSPRGFPERYDPFTEAPYVGFLKERIGHDRVVGGHGMLFPNFSSAVGIQDIRYINALSLSSFHEFKERFLQEEPAWYASLWFTGRQERKLDLDKGITRLIEGDLLKNLDNFSFFGVRYLVFPSGFDLNERAREFWEYGAGRPPVFPLVYEGEDAVVYENPFAFPRVFMGGEPVYAGSYEEAHQVFGSPGFSKRGRIIIEGDPPAGFAGGPSAGRAEITDYRANWVTVKAHVEDEGFLVLTDAFSAGWRAYVDQKPSRIHRVNGVVRGVFLDKGVHTVVFRYLPEGFVLGCSLSALAALAVIALIILGRRGKTGAA